MNARAGRRLVRGGPCCEHFDGPNRATLGTDTRSRVVFVHRSAVLRSDRQVRCRSAAIRARAREG